MLRSLKSFERYTIAATDGAIGTAVNFLVEDERWTVRYLVAETGSFFDGRRVLVSPISIRSSDCSTRRFNVALTMEKVRCAPPVDADPSVSRQHEIALSKYYEHTYYWGFAGLWGITSDPRSLDAGSWCKPTTAPTFRPERRHLRSMNEMCGYHVQGSDGELGHVQDFIVDDQSWEIRYIVVDTSNWLFGKRVLVAPQWVSLVGWDERKIYFHMSRESIKDSPDWKAAIPINRDYESRLYHYYGRPDYWSAYTANQHTST